MTKLIERVNNARAALACAEMMYHALLASEHYMLQRDVTLRRVIKGAWVADLQKVLGAELLECAESPERMALYAHERADEETGVGEIHGVLIYELNQRGVTVEDLVVSEAHRRQGVGSELVRALEEECVRLHRWHVSFLVNGSNRTAKLFWAKNGYPPEAFAYARELEKPKVFATQDGKPVIVTAGDDAKQKPAGPLIMPKRYRVEEPS